MDQVYVNGIENRCGLFSQQESGLIDVSCRESDCRYRYPVFWDSAVGRARPQIYGFEGVLKWRRY
jgi:hypothetical protein